MFSELAPRLDLQTTGNSVLRKAPSTWAIRPMRSLIKSRSERNRTDLALLSVARERGVFVRTADDANHNVIPEDLTNYKVARQGDLVINKMKAWQGSLGLAPEDGIVSPAYYVYDFSIENRQYGEALLRSKPYVALMGAASDGVRIGQWDLSVQRFREIPVLVPPADEQTAIVKYLGHAHARIDRAIAAKRKLIALLEEQKQAIVHQAVTRGLDLTVPLKDSGIPWLGEIPAHWGLLLAQHLFRPVWRPVIGDQLPQMSLTRSHGLVVSGTEGSNTQAAETAGNLQTCLRGDFVLNKYRAHLGLFRSCKTDGIVTKNYTVLAPTRLVNNSYFELLFLDPVFASGLQVMSRGVGEGMSPLYTATLLGMKMPVPSPQEQRQIALHAAEELASLDLAADRARREIELLREFRTRLTSDVVTGQVDVREIAATLPELTDNMLASTTDDAGDSSEDIAEAFLEGETD